MTNLNIAYTRVQGDGEKMRIAHDFAEQLTASLFLQSHKYAAAYKNIYGYYEYPLMLNERYIYSALSTSVDRLATVHLPEMPVSRVRELEGKKVDSGQFNGRVDHWAYYRNTEFLLEVKQKYLGVGSKGKGVEVQAAWHSLVTQMKSVANHVRSWEVTAVSMGLLVLYPYTKRETRRSSWSSEESDRLVADVAESMGEDLSFYGVWHLPEGMRTLDLDDGGKEFSPLIMIAGAFLVHRQ